MITAIKTFNNNSLEHILYYIIELDLALLFHDHFMIHEHDNFLSKHLWSSD